VERVGAQQPFEDHYGTTIGDCNEDQSKVCSFRIAHVDERNELLWYNGSLLKNKLKNHTEFDVPTLWMLAGEWEKDATKPDISYMKKEAVRENSVAERKILRTSVETSEGD